MSEESEYKSLINLPRDDMYVGFLDILGFGNKVITEFDNILNAYDSVLKNISNLKEKNPSLSMRIYSDSILLTSSNLVDIIRSVNILCMITLFEDCLIRGGIAYGKHVESS